MQKTSLSSGGKNIKEQRSCAPNHDHPPSNYRFSFGSFGTKVISVCGWRFAPACCAAQSVIRCGPGCAVPLHRLPWAAVNLHRRNELHRSNVSAKGNENLHLSGFNWRQANQAARPNWSLNRTLCGGPGLGFKSLAQIPTHRNRPVSSNVRPRIFKAVLRRRPLIQTASACASAYIPSVKSARYKMHPEPNAEK